MTVPDRNVFGVGAPLIGNLAEFHGVINSPVPASDSYNNYELLRYEVLT